MGFVETFGIAAAIEAADIMLKAANVKVKTVANADAGLITVFCHGDLASCQAAVDAAKAGPAVSGNCINSHSIPRPSQDVQGLVDKHIGNLLKPVKTKKPKAAAKKADQTKK